jgi:hypothetical protein
MSSVTAYSDEALLAPRPPLDSHERATPTAPQLSAQQQQNTEPELQPTRLRVRARPTQLEKFLSQNEPIDKLEVSGVHGCGVCAHTHTRTHVRARTRTPHLPGSHCVTMTYSTGERERERKKAKGTWIGALQCSSCALSALARLDVIKHMAYVKGRAR